MFCEIPALGCMLFAEATEAGGLPRGPTSLRAPLWATRHSPHLTPAEEGSPRTHTGGHALELCPLRLLTAGGKEHESPEDLHSRGAQAVRGATTTPPSVSEGSASWSPIWTENEQNEGRHVVAKPTTTAQVFKSPQWRAPSRDLSNLIISEYDTPSGI